MVLSRNKVWLVLCLVLLVLPSLPRTAWAADVGSTLESTNFKIDVKPEYDDSRDRTLVIYQSDFTNLGSEIVKKGTPVSFIIPKGAEIGMACEINAQGGHDCQPYTEQDLGNNQVKLSWKITKDIAQNQKYPTYLEFYYDNGSVPPAKAFDYQFNPTYKLDTLNVNIVAPKAATNFTTTPVATTTSQDSDGLKQYTFSYKNQTFKDPLNIKVAYNKADNKPTFDKPQVGATQTAVSSTPSASWLSKPEFWVPTILLIAVLAVGLIFGLGRSKDSKGGRPKNQKSVWQASSTGKLNSTTPDGKNGLNQERRRLRRLLLDGEINEDTYRQLAAELDQEER